MNKLLQYLALTREYLFPAGCAICGSMLLDPEEAWYGLCRDCRLRFAIRDEPRCSSCGRPLISEQGRCLPCREGEDRAFDGAFVLYPYTGKYRELLRAYKFGKSRPLGNFFAEKLLDAYTRFVPAYPCVGTAAAETVWVPVPPRPGKLKASGWDQIDYLAGRLERFHRVSVSRCLKRLPSRSQKELNRENRKTNLRGRIICTKKPPTRVLLFDDVITTGSTLDACAAALKEAGAEKVYAVCLFYD
jgi:ComF family protein